MFRMLPVICLASLTLCSLIRFCNNTDYLWLEFFSQFSFQYALVSLLLSVLCFRKKQAAFGVLAGLLFVFNINAVIDFNKQTHAADHTGTAFKIYSANIYKNNLELSKLNAEIRKNDPDIVLLLEVTPEHIEQLRPIMLSYPYRVENIFEGVLGFVFLSRFPVHDYHITKLSEYGNSLLEAMMYIDRNPVMFYGLHAQRPDRGDFSERKSQLFEPAMKIKEQPLPAIVAGDFNMTPHSPVFRKFMRIAGLKDSRDGFGWQPSWPTFFLPFWITIDHVLVTSDFQVVRRNLGSYVGSDHYPVITELSLAL